MTTDTTTLMMMDVWSSVLHAPVGHDDILAVEKNISMDQDLR
jgi:hypothetical protein